MLQARNLLLADRADQPPVAFYKYVDAVLKELAEILREPPKDNRLITSAKQRAFAAMIKQVMEEK